MHWEKHRETVSPGLAALAAGVGRVGARVHDLVLSEVEARLDLFADTVIRDLSTRITELETRMERRYGHLAAEPVIEVDELVRELQFNDWNPARMAEEHGTTEAHIVHLLTDRWRAEAALRERSVGLPRR